MKYSYGWLKEYVPKIPEPKKLADLVMTKAFEVEDLEKSGNDYVLDINVLPNRAFDCLSHIGMAREIGAICGCRLRTTDYRLKEDKKLKTSDYLKVEVKEKKLCPRYSGRVMLNVKVGNSPKWMQERLVACGLRPINNIVDATNYVMLEYGQPLHAFDFDKINGCDANIRMHTNDTNKKTIIVRRAKRGERMTTLDDEKKELDESVLVIADTKEPLAIAGIKGGKKAEIDKKTKNIILEAANFDSVSTRKSSRKLGLRTDSSIRFENGLDISLTKQALDRVAGLIQEIAGGEIISGMSDVCLLRPKKATTGVFHDHIESLLGVKIKNSEVLNILKRLQLDVKVIKKKNKIFYEVIVPSWRNDLLTSEDLIEEIGRLYGYEKIVPEIPASVLIPAIKNEELINEDKAKDIMVGMGYSEINNYSLISEERKRVFALEGVIGPWHPLSQDQKYLRSTLIVRLLENMEDNLKYFKEVRIFEIGKIFKQENKKIKEKKMVAGGLYRDGAKAEDLFREMKGVVDLLLEKMGVSGFNYHEIKDKIDTKIEEIDKLGMYYPRRAQIKIGEKEIGLMGQINRALLGGETIPAMFFELDFELLNSLIQEEIGYRAPSKYPSVIRDLSVLVGPKTKVADVLNIIENIGGLMVVDVDLLDIYQDERGKSFTFRIVYQSDQKNLTDAEVNKIQEKIIKAIEEKGWEIKR